jgi:hypothetical protein
VFKTNTHDRLTSLQAALERAVEWYANSQSNKSQARRDYLRAAASYGRFVARHVKGRVAA